MNATESWRLFWKEYRTQRAYWLAVLLLTVACQFLAWVSKGEYDPGRADGIFLVTVLIPCIGVLGSSAVLFAGEKEAGTDDLLRRCSVSIRALLAAKVGFTATAALASAGALLLVAVAITFPSLSKGQVEFGSMAALAGLLMVELLAWGCLFSLLFDRSINAVAGALLAASVTRAIVIPLTVDQSTVPFHAWMRYGWPVYVGIAALVLAVDAWLAGRWLSRPIEWSMPALGLRRLIGLRERSFSADSDTTPGPRRLFGRLLWQARREAWPGAFIAIAGACAAVQFVNADHDWKVLFVTVTLGLPAFLGVLGFREETVNGRYRFLADRGISAGSVWLSKQMVWLPLLVIGAFVVPMSYILPRLHGSSIDAVASRLLHKLPLFAVREAWLGVIFCATSALAIFALGQLLGLIVRSSVTALFVALALAVPIVPALGLLTFAWKLPIVPAIFVAILFAAGLIRATDWLHERRGAQPLVRLGASTLVPIALLIAGVGVYRVYEIPANGPGFDVGEFRQSYFNPTRTPAGLETRAIYQKIAGEYTGEKPTYDRMTSSAIDGWEKANPLEKEHLEKNLHLVESFLAAAQRPDFAGITRDEDSPCEHDDLVGKLRHFSRLLRLSAREREANGRLAEALARYEAALGMAAQMEAGRGYEFWLYATITRRGVCDWLPKWIEHPKQTPELLARARSVVAAQLARGRPILFAESQMIGAATYGYEFSRRTWPAWTWEHYRQNRLFAAMARQDVAFAIDLERQLSAEGGYVDVSQVQRYEQDVESMRLENWFRTTFGFELGQSRWSYVDDATRAARSEMHLRATVIQLALAEWKLRHGQYPRTLDELLALDPKLPLIDPFNGEMFGYRPEGFPQPVQFQEPGYLERYDAQGRPLPYACEPGQPMLWSAGRFFVRLLPKVEDDKVGYEFVSTEPTKTSRARRGPAGGWAFPLP